MPFRAVLLDWRGTLVTTLDEEAWATEALRRLGRDDDPGPLADDLATIADRLDAPGVDTDAGRHRRTYVEALSGLGVDDDLTDALYAVESDVTLNVFADDAAAALRELCAAGVRLAVVSDIHVDIRPAFTAAGLDDVVDVFTLSVEHGIQKPDPRMFTRTLCVLGVDPEHALMVGDRAERDGAAVECGLATLLLPPLTAPSDRRLHRVLALCRR